MNADLVMAGARVDAARMIFEANVLQFTAAAALGSDAGTDRARVDALSAAEAYLDAIAAHRMEITKHIRRL